jgi:GDP-L-galactose phosphorylase
VVGVGQASALWFPFLTADADGVRPAPSCQAKGQVPEEMLATMVDPAAFEICGHLVLKREVDYETITQDMAWQLLELASQDEQQFLETVRVILNS